ncbi:MAG: LON peptidase substrate-binding domain-containing protein [Paracoccus sp. (in: a-proteobacteria)]|uniref:LON peptidase substrate-binding domain-containing protein n=1 Tax=Paracoccus sp. TaxID=267 RepID=UPI0026E0E44E|nr:LON peptidase substrate-binding domain-containing protein [Paracoccus sp. (in: a-proteobacteria)]MDO5621478.1 LON peptidase substrate-binding domain-containing protein [Paracoccus sp. (in: a-proteobacteria)]
MARGFDLPAALPLFPLPGAVLLPRGHLPLHIFEPRYLQMIEDVLKTPDRMLGMIQPLGDGLARVGTGGRIVAFSEEDDGRLMISLRAVSRFRLIEAQEGFAPYLRGQVDWSGFDADKGPEEQDRDFDREPFLKRLGQYMAEHELTTDWQALSGAADEVLINALSQLLPLPPEEKQALLEAATLAERRALLAGLIEYDLRSDGEETLQ